MTTIQITPALKVTMLKHLVAGRDLDFVATATHTPRDRVLDIVSKHGYPDVDRMKWAIDIVTKEGGQIPERAPVVDHRPKVLLDEPVRDTGGRTQDSPFYDGPGKRTTNIRSDQPTKPYQSAPSGAVNIPSATADVLRQAGQSQHGRTRALAAKISALLADLTARLADEQAEVEAKTQAAKENAAVTARIAVLQAEIDKLKGKRAKPAKTITSTGRGIVAGEYLCQREACGRSFTTVQGVHLHYRRAHEGFNPVKAAS